VRGPPIAPGGHCFLFCQVTKSSSKNKNPRTTLSVAAIHLHVVNIAAGWAGLNACSGHFKTLDHKVAG
jgi:hypothetical protein